MIKIVCFDIDGILTDGKVYVTSNGNELKTFRLTEIDALNDIRRLGFKIGAITGEDTPIVDVFRNKVPWDFFVVGCKDKLSELRRIADDMMISADSICYIGDGKYDVPCIEYAGLGVCPSNAIQEAKDVADIVLNGAGGESCIYELYQILKKMKEDQQ